MAPPKNPVSRPGRALAGLVVVIIVMLLAILGKDMVSRAWQRTRPAWEAWQKRDLAGEGIVRLILDGTVVKVRLDKRATAISLLIALGIRRDGQKVVLAIKNLGGESEAAWRGVLDDLMVRGMVRPELVIVDGGKGLEGALASL